jgi:hypothetical protein
MNLAVSCSSRRAFILLTLIAPTDYFDAVKKFGAHYCFFCTDHCGSSHAICIHCGTIVCIATHRGSAGCIGHQTATADLSKFECNYCIRSKKTTTTVIPYYLAGSGNRRTPKIVWPLLLFAIRLKNLDSLVLRQVTLTAESNYRLEKENVRLP